MNRRRMLQWLAAAPVVAAPTVPLVNRLASAMPRQWKAMQSVYRTKLPHESVWTTHFTRWDQSGQAIRRVRTWRIPNRAPAEIRNLRLRDSAYDAHPVFERVP